MKSHLLTIGTLIGLIGIFYGLNKIPYLLPGLIVVGIIVYWYMLLHNLYSKINHNKENNPTGMDIEVHLEEGSEDHKDNRD